MDMNGLKRDELKYVRDISKSAYKKEDNCYICRKEEDLDFHHFTSMSALWAKWKKDNKIIIKSVDDILEQREVFKEKFHNEIYNKTVTLCRICHRERLHKIYGKCPALSTADKQERWVEKQRIKSQEKLSG